MSEPSQSFLSNTLALSFINAVFTNPFYRANCKDDEVRRFAEQSARQFFKERSSGAYEHWNFIWVSHMTSPIGSSVPLDFIMAVWQNEEDDVSLKYFLFTEEGRYAIAQKDAINAAIREWQEKSGVGYVKTFVPLFNQRMENVQ